MTMITHNRYTVMNDVLAAGIKHGRIGFYVEGDCMEGSGICDGDILGVDFTRYPKPPIRRENDKRRHEDACLCYGAIPGTGAQPCLMVKSYAGVFLGMQMVGTRYKQLPDQPYRMNCGFEPIAIFGVVYACWRPDGTLKWELDVSDYPEELGTKTTIKGGNIADEPIRTRPSTRHKAKEAVPV